MIVEAQWVVGILCVFICSPTLCLEIFMIKGFHRIILSSANTILQKNDYFDTGRVGTRSGVAHL